MANGINDPLKINDLVSEDGINKVASKEVVDLVQGRTTFGLPGGGTAATLDEGTAKRATDAGFPAVENLEPAPAEADIKRGGSFQPKPGKTGTGTEIGADQALNDIARQSFVDDTRKRRDEAQQKADAIPTDVRSVSKSVPEIKPYFDQSKENANSISSMSKYSADTPEDVEALEYINNWGNGRGGEKNSALWRQHFDRLQTISASSKNKSARERATSMVLEIGQSLLSAESNIRSVLATATPRKNAQQSYSFLTKVMRDAIGDETLYDYYMGTPQGVQLRAKLMEDIDVTGTHEDLRTDEVHEQKILESKQRILKPTTATTTYNPSSNAVPAIPSSFTKDEDATAVEFYKAQPGGETAIAITEFSDQVSSMPVVTGKADTTQIISGVHDRIAQKVTTSGVTSAEEIKSVIDAEIVAEGANGLKVGATAMKEFYKKVMGLTGEFTDGVTGAAQAQQERATRAVQASVIQYSNGNPKLTPHAANITEEQAARAWNDAAQKAKNMAGYSYEGDTTANDELIMMLAIRSIAEKTHGSKAFSETIPLRIEDRTRSDVGVNLYVSAMRDKIDSAQKQRKEFVDFNQQAADADYLLKTNAHPTEPMMSASIVLPGTGGGSGKNIEAIFPVGIGELVTEILGSSDGEMNSALREAVEPNGILNVKQFEESVSYRNRILHGEVLLGDYPNQKTMERYIGTLVEDPFKAAKGPDGYIQDNASPDMKKNLADGLMLLQFQIGDPKISDEKAIQNFADNLEPDSLFSTEKGIRESGDVWNMIKTSSNVMKMLKHATIDEKTRGAAILVSMLKESAEKNGAQVANSALKNTVAILVPQLGIQINQPDKSTFETKDGQLTPEGRQNWIQETEEVTYNAVLAATKDRLNAVSPAALNFDVRVLDNIQKVVEEVIGFAAKRDEVLASRAGRRGVVMSDFTYDRAERLATFRDDMYGTVRAARNKLDAASASRGRVSRQQNIPQAFRGAQ